jgi:hypothetical protein
MIILQELRLKGFMKMDRRRGTLSFRLCHQGDSLFGAGRDAKAAADAAVALDPGGLLEGDRLHLAALDADAATGAEVLVDLGIIVRGDILGRVRESFKVL